MRIYLSGFCSHIPDKPAYSPEKIRALASIPISQSYQRFMMTAEEIITNTKTYALCETKDRKIIVTTTCGHLCCIPRFAGETPKSEKDILMCCDCTQQKGVWIDNPPLIGPCPICRYRAQMKSKNALT